MEGEGGGVLVSLQQVPGTDQLFLGHLEALLLVAVEAADFHSLPVGDEAELFCHDHLKKQK